MILKWLLVGFIAGAISKMMRARDDGKGWLSSLAMGGLGAVIGSYLGGFLEFTEIYPISLFVAAIFCSWIVLYIYHKFLTQYF